MNRPIVSLTLIVATALALLPMPKADAGVFANFVAARHERFIGGAPNPNFILDESRLSGIGGGAALITPQHFVSASHIGLLPSATFRGGDGVSRTYNVSSSEPLTTTFTDPDTMMVVTENSDIRIYTLDAPIPSTDLVTPVPILQADVSSLIGQEFFSITRFDQAGKNIIDAIEVVEFNNGTGPSVNIRYDFDTTLNGGTDPAGLDEVALQSGDSGRQAIFDFGGQYGLIGSHFGISDVDGPSDRSNYDSFSTYLSSYLDDIDDITLRQGFTASRLTITPVPEPSAIALTGVATIAWVKRRRRSNESSGSH